ncbi:MAG TPA: N-methyl-L-tryptophan oxidase [Gemmatimonadales bacterium]
MTIRCDVAIAGLGAMGSAAAWQLTLRGQRVIGFDRFRPPHAMGSSTGKSRIIREAYFENPGYVPLVRRAYELWADLEQDSGRELLRPTGGLVIGPEDGSLVPGALASARLHGVRHELLDAGAIRARYPAFRPDATLAGLLELRAGVLMPEDCIGAMLGQAGQAGAELRFEEPVLGWEPDGDGVRVTTGVRTVLASRLILSAGAWMEASLTRRTLPLTVARQVMFWVRPGGDPGLFDPGRFPIWLWETNEGPTWYGFPDLGDGPKVARHHGGQVTTADHVERGIDPEESGPVRAFLAKAIPLLDGPVTDARVCMYTNTPDEDFVLDRHPDHPAVLIASPCSGHGFKFAPTVGEILADLAMDRTPRFDLTPFSSSRFTPA